MWPTGAPNGETATASMTASRLRITRAHLLLLLCGLLSLAAYGFAFIAPYNLYFLTSQGAIPDLGRITGYSPAAFWRYVGCLAALFALYGFGVALAGNLQDRGSLWVVLGCGLAAALLLVQVYPYAASDVFLYIVRGRVLGVYGHNSLVVPPSAFPTETYLPFYSEWADTPSPYGPLWEWIAAGLARLGDGSLLRSLIAFKALGLLSYIGCALLLAAILRARRPEGMLRGLILFAWNPLVLLETHAMAHNDLCMVFFVLLALWFWERERYPWVIVSLVLGGLVKYVPFVLLPPTLLLMWRRLGWRAWLQAVSSGILLSLAPAALTLAPLWRGPKTLSVIGQMGQIHNSVAAWVIVALKRFTSIGPAFDLGLWVVRVLFILVYVLVLFGTMRGTSSLIQVYYRLLYTWLCFGAAAFGYWYIAWLIAMIPLLESFTTRLFTVVFSWCGLMSVVLYTFSYDVDAQHVHLIVVPFVFVLPLLAAYALDRLRYWRRLRRRNAG